MPYWKTFVLSILLISSCKSPTSNQQDKIVAINMSTLADNFGDNNGLTSNTELDSLNSYFNLNEYAWFLGGVPFQDSLGTTYSFRNHIHPYPTEQQLRNAFEGIAIRTLYVTIIVLAKTNSQIVLEQCYTAPGPDISHGIWVPGTFP